MLEKALYLLLMPSAAIAVLTFCSVSRAGILVKYAAWVFWLAGSILAGLLVFSSPIGRFTLSEALAVALAVLVWAMIAVSIFLGGPIGLIRSVLKERRKWK